MQETEAVAIADLESSEPYTRLLAVRKLGEGKVLWEKGMRGVEALAKLLTSDSEARVRQEAAWALGKIENRGEDRIAVPPLVNALLKDTEDDVRVTAAASLGIYGGTAAAEGLQRAISSGSSLRVQMEALRALAGISTRQNLGDQNPIEDHLNIIAQEGQTSELRHAALAHVEILRRMKNSGT